MGSQVLLTSLAAGPEAWGCSGMIKKVCQAEGQEPQYWLMLDGAKGSVQCLHAPASWCTLAAELPAHPTAPAPLTMDLRLRGTKAFLQTARARVLGSNHPSSIELCKPNQYAEINELTCLLEEVVARVPAPPTCSFFGPFQCRAWDQPELDAEATSLLRDAFEQPKTDVQMVAWGPNHFGCLTFQVGPPPADWAQAYEPPRQWQCQFYDPLPGGHEGLTAVCRRLFQHVKAVANLQGDALPAATVPQGWLQKDGWSCGYHSTRYLEVQRRLLRGELPAPIPSMEAFLAKNNAIVQQLQKLQCEFKGVPWPLGKPGPDHAEGEDEEDPGDQKGPGDGDQEPGDHKGPGHKKGPPCPKPPPLPAEPASLDDAMARALVCSKCKPRKRGDYAGQKGCTKCMGSWFQSMRTNKPAGT